MAVCLDQAWCLQRCLVAGALWTLMHINELSGMTILQHNPSPDSTLLPEQNESQTRVKNITFPKLRLRAVTIHGFRIQILGVFKYFNVT